MNLNRPPMPLDFTLALPTWVPGFLAEQEPLPQDESSWMGLAVALAARNVAEGTGGPFGALMADTAAGRLVSVGVNVVMADDCSLAHAEVMAIALAQRRAGSYTLAGAGGAPLTLFSSADPCAMCCGAIAWSGVRRVVCGASRSQVEAIGFDEGPIHPHWVAELQRRGIEVARGVRAAEALTVLEAYLRAGGAVYNP